MKSIKVTHLFIACLSFALLMLSFSFRNVKTPAPAAFVAPAWADTIKNPLKGNVSSIADGKKTYTTYCVVCHGDKGKGDGVASAGLSKPPADHSSVAVQRQSDGAIYWKMSEGNSPMPSYKSSLTVTQRWQLVDYIRTLAKPAKK